MLPRRRLHDPLQRSLQPIGRGFRVFGVARHSPALRYVAPGEKAGEPLNVKQITRSAVREQWPISGCRHSWAGGCTGRAWRFGVPVTLLSAPGAALFAGCGWWRALVEQARAEFADVAIDDILDCADASGLAAGSAAHRPTRDRARPGCAWLGRQSPRSPRHLAARCWTIASGPRSIWPSRPKPRDCTIGCRCEPPRVTATTPWS